MPPFVTHYTSGRPFRSMMGLDDEARRAWLDTGTVANPERYAHASYVDTRLRVEARMYEQFVAIGGRPRVRHPHYALVGRSPRAEARPRPEGAGGYTCPFHRLPAGQVSFTWDDSFLFDPYFRDLSGRHHPASAQVYRLAQLPGILERWGSSTDKPAWQWIEVQLWYDPDPGEFERIPLPATDVARGAPGTT